VTRLSMSKSLSKRVNRLTIRANRSNGPLTSIVIFGNIIDVSGVASGGDRYLKPSTVGSCGCLDGRC
jgi:hypothetical protein